MEAKSEYDPRDLTVHLRDAALYVLMRWRRLLATALVGAIVFTGVRYAQDLHTYRAGQSAPAPMATLSADSRARVASAMGYQAAYRRVCTYNETAPLMQVDPGAAPTRRMRLLITGEGCWTAACLYREHVMSESLYRPMAEEGIPAAYLAELVTVEIESEPTWQTPMRAFLTVQVLAPTEELCNRLSSVVRRTVEEVFAVVTAAAGEHACTWVFDRYAVLRDETVAARQQAELEQQSQLRDQHAAAQRMLTAEEKEYILRLMGQTSATDPAPPPSIRRTAWLWGFLLGGGVALMWLLLRYLFCGRVLSAADMVSRHGVAVVGVLGESVTHPLYRRLKDHPEDAALVWQRLAVSAVTAGVTRLYVATTDSACLDGLAAALERQGVALLVGDSPAVDGAGAERFSSCDGFVTAARWGHTAHRTVAEELALARQWRIPVLGALLLQ